MNFLLKNFLKTIFTVLTLVFGFGGLARAEIFNLSLYKEENGRIRFDRQFSQPLRLINGGEPMNYDGNYKARIISFTDAILAIVNFQPLLAIAGDKFDPEINQYKGKMIFQETGSFPFILQLPYFPNAQYAEIFDPDGNKQLKIYLTAFARCNENKICEAGETEKECSSDCQPKPPLTTFGKFWRIGLTLLYWLGILGLIVFLAIKIKNRIKKKKDAKQQ